MTDSPATPDRVAEDARRLLLRGLEARARLLESAAYDLSPFMPLSPQDLGIADTPNFMPPFGQGLTWLNRRKNGEYIPVFLTEQQLSLYRREIRAVVVNNEIAINAVNVHVAYAVGEGFKYEAQAKPGKDVPEELVDAVQAIVDEFCECNEMPLREAETLSRMLIDGEAFLRTFAVEGDDILRVRPVEPEYVFSRDGDTTDSSFGVVTDPQDVENVLGYMIQPDPDTSPVPELVKAQHVVHFKWPETPSTSKRGLSAFFPCKAALKMAEELLLSTVSLAKARAKIAWIETMEGGTADAAAALLANQAIETVTDPQTGESVSMDRVRMGTVMRVPGGMKIEMPSANVAAGEHVQVMQMVLRMIASRFSMPEYMLSSDASNANYSSTLVAESPWVKSMQRLQAALGRLLAGNRRKGPRRSLIWRQIVHSIKAGRLPKEAFKLVDVQAVGPTLVVRDVQKEAQVDSTYAQMGVKSITTIRLEQGLDPDEEDANIEAEAKKAAAREQKQGGQQQPGQQQAEEAPQDADQGDEQPQGEQSAEEVIRSILADAQGGGGGLTESVRRLVEEIIRKKDKNGRKFAYDTVARKRVPYGTGEGGGGEAPEAKPAAKTRQARPKPEKPDAGKLADDLRRGVDGANGSPDPARVAEFQAALSKLTVKEINTLKAALGVKASGTKAQLIDKLIARAGQAKPQPPAKPQPKPRPKPAGKPAKPVPAKPPAGPPAEKQKPVTRAELRLHGSTKAALEARARAKKAKEEKEAKARAEAEEWAKTDEAARGGLARLLGLVESYKPDVPPPPPSWGRDAFQVRLAAVRQAKAMRAAWESGPVEEATKQLIASLDAARRPIADRLSRDKYKMPAATADELERRCGQLSALKNAAGEALADAKRKTFLAAFGTGGAPVQPLFDSGPEAFGEVGGFPEKAFAEAASFVGSLLPPGSLDHIGVVPNLAGRDSYSGGEIYITGKTGASTVAHEIGHHLEYDQRVRGIVTEFRRERFDPKDDAPMNSFANIGRTYEDYEVGNPDDMEKLTGDRVAAAYIGKWYNSGETEIVSMGVDYLFRDPIHFAAADPKYFAVMIEILQGAKR